MPSRGQQLGKLLNSSGDIAETSLPPKIETFSQSVSNTGKIEVAALGDDVSTIEQVSDTNSLSASGNAVGDQRVVGNTLYIWNGSGWYRIALINETPTWDSGGQPSASYILDADSPQDATIITLAASDPDGLPITYSYITSGSMDSMATISQDSSVFTITPKTVAQVGEGVQLTGSITFRASDGVNILPSVSSFTLSFIFIIENSKYTTLLAAAVDTSDNNTIVDSSSNNETITVYGNPSAGSFSPYRRGGYSTYFDGNGDFLSASTTDFQHSGNFTYECWVWWDGTVPNDWPMIFDTRSSNSSSSNSICVNIHPTDYRLNFYLDGTNYYWGSTGLPSQSWVHIAVVRSSGTVSIYQNGVPGTSTRSNSNTFSGASGIRIGGNVANIGWWPGYISDFRVVDDAVYTSNFSSSLPTERLTAVTNTSLLTCHLPYIADGSTNNHTITVNGDTSTKPFTPYDDLEYSAVDHGGSIYFDQGSNLTLADNDNWDLTSSNFTIKFWVYMQQDTFPSGYIKWIDDAQTTTSTQGNWTLGVQSNKQVRLTIWDSSGTLSNIYSGTSKLIHNNRWYYVEWSGGTVKVNGETYISYTHPNTGAIGGNMVIGSGQNHAGTREAYMKGYIADLHFVNGSTAAESSIPTAPMSLVSDTKLLIKGTDASIIDKSQSSNIVLANTAVGSTDQFKFANTKSLKFYGSSNYARAKDVPALRTGDFTYEGWIYTVSGQAGTANTFFDTRSVPTSSADGFYIMHRTDNSNKFRVGTDGTVFLNSTNSYDLDTWHHWALVRSGTTCTFYINGVADATTFTSSMDITSQDVTLGASMAGTGNTWVYLQDVRISSYARYTANFTPPTEPLKG